jgi:outer membrane protein insertion porin family
MLILACIPARGQTSLKVSRIEIKHVENNSLVSDQMIRSNIRVRPGDPYTRAAVDDDVRNLYATGQFYNIRVNEDVSTEGVALTYVLQGNPRLTEIKFEGNTKYKDSKLKKKVTSKVGEPLNESKLFTDGREIQKLYEKAGYTGTKVEPVVAIDQLAGRGSVTFKVTEQQKIKITGVEFVGANAFPEKKLRKVLKTRKRWMFSWITGSGVYKEDQFDEDKERLAEYYREKGYIDFEIKDIQLTRPTPNKMVIRFIVSEGRQYKVGAISFQGVTMLPTNVVAHNFVLPPEPKAPRDHVAWEEARILNRSFSMKVGDTFTPDGLNKDADAVRNFYGSKGHVDVKPGSRNLIVSKIPNTERGTMDLSFKVDEGQQSFIEKIEIRGNVKTKDTVIRRELAVAPGDVYDTVRINTSKQRLEGLDYFSKVDTREEPTEVPNQKNLIIGVDEKQTGNLTVGAGFSSVDSLVGYAEIYQGNFDLFKPPRFTGGGQKFRLKVQLGTERKDVETEFTEPWFLEKKLRLSVALYYRELDFLSPNDLYRETLAGSRVGLNRALGSDFLIGGVGYTIQDVGIQFKNNAVPAPTPPNPPLSTPDPGEVVIPRALAAERDHSVLSIFDASISYDTRGPGFLPTKGQQTTLALDLAGPFGGEKDFYKVELKTHWYFKGFAAGHVLEVLGGTGIADAYGRSGDVPFYERYYLGGLNNLRGYEFNNVSPREDDGAYSNEPIGGNTYWFGSLEYSVPIIDRLRFAVFYDVGNVMLKSYGYTVTGYSDNWGFGIRLNLPIGGGSGTPLRLDYGIPIHHDKFNGGSGRFQFSVGFDRPF